MTEKHLMHPREIEQEYEEKIIEQFTKLDNERKELRAELAKMTAERDALDTMFDSHTRQIQTLINDRRKLRAELASTKVALAELYALVNGECPRLLDDDRGGDSRLAITVEEILAAGEAEKKGG